MDRVRIGIIGLGWMGSEHGRNVLNNKKAELVSVADSNKSNVLKFFKEHNFECKHFQNYSELLEDKIDAVVIASPNNLHAEMCMEAARRKKHIYCEKPMAISLEDCRRVREAVEKYRVKYLIGYHRRLNPLYQYTKDLLKRGKLGQPFFIESDYIHHIPGDWDIWKWLGKEEIGGSIFHAGSGHNVDLLRYFCGDIKEVVCFKDIFLPRKNQIETEDTAVALFRFKNDAIGKVQLCVGAVSPFTFNFKLYGTKGSVINNKIWFENILLSSEPGQENDCLELPGDWIPDNVPGAISEPWNKLMDHFVDMLTENTGCINDVVSAYQTSVSCFAAVKSARTGKVIKIDEMA